MNDDSGVELSLTLDAVTMKRNCRLNYEALWENIKCFYLYLMKTIRESIYM